jgi:hypothetical protein
MFTMNAMDHVEDFKRMADEVHRVIAPGGALIGSFNLNEPPTESEPQTLTEDIVQELLLSRFTVKRISVGPKNIPGRGSVYQHMVDGGAGAAETFCGSRPSRLKPRIPP